METISPFHLAQCIAALRIETITGMRHSKGSVLRLVQSVYGVQSTTKAGALTELEKLYEQEMGHPYGVVSHVGHNITTRTQVTETYRTEWDNDVLLIIKNEEYEVDEVNFFCNDCCVDIDADEIKYEWNT
jgi:hypothetical protein